MFKGWCLQYKVSFHTYYIEPTNHLKVFPNYRQILINVPARLEDTIHRVFMWKIGSPNLLSIPRFLVRFSLERELSRSLFFLLERMLQFETYSKAKTLAWVGKAFQVPTLTFSVTN